MFKTSGINVSPLEMERFLEIHLDVKETHVVGIPDEAQVEVGAAFIKLVLRARRTEEDMVKHRKGQIVSYKVPKYFRFVSEFPLTGTGKVKKQELRDQILASMPGKGL